MTSPDNPFAPPEADVAPSATDAQFPWFLVGTKKLVVMIFVTFGLYVVYWFERQYRFQKRVHGESTWPLARGLFSLFFAHDLFRRIAVENANEDLHHDWDASNLGRIYVVSIIASRVLDRVTRNTVDLAFSVIVTLLTIGLLGGLAWPLFKVQGTINEIAAHTHPTIDRNENFTVWNGLVIVLGSILMFFAIVGPFIPA